MHRCIVFFAILTAFLPGGTILFADNTEVKHQIAFFTPTSENNTYWPQVYAILASAAAVLQTEIMVYEFEVGDRFAMPDEGSRILSREPRPDGAICSVAFGQVKPLLDTAEQLQIPMMIHGPLFDEELPALGYRPRSVYSSWLAVYSQKEKEKGYLLAKELIHAALESENPDTTGGIQILGISGDHTWEGSLQREEGLRQAVQEFDQARLLQIVPTFWTLTESRDKTAQLLLRYPQTRIVWTASDQLGIGAALAIEDMGKTPGADVLIGGLDLSTTGLEQVLEGRFTATVSATLFSYVEILIYLVDYLNGRDFLDSTGTYFSPSTHVATAENAARYISLYSKYRDIDFSLLSRSLNPKLADYDFSLESIEGALKN